VMIRPAFFELSPRMATLMDQRSASSSKPPGTSWKAPMTSAEHLRRAYDAKVGVFGRNVPSLYGAFAGDDVEQAAHRAGLRYNGFHRVSFFFDLRGPSVALDTMVSIVADAIEHGLPEPVPEDCQLADAPTAVNLSIHPKNTSVSVRRRSSAAHPGSRQLSATAMASCPPRGRCGAAQTLGRAFQDNDTILAVIQVVTDQITAATRRLLLRPTPRRKSS